MLRVVTWLWKPLAGFRSDYTSARVNTLYRMVRRHLHMPWEPVCITDMPAGLDPDIRVVPLWDDYRDLLPPRADQSHPGCYNRLKAFAPEMREIIGHRFVSIDIDSVVVGDLTPLFDRPEPFVIWHPDRQPEKKYPLKKWNGSMWMMTAGAHPEVWTQFTGLRSARCAVREGYYPADQGWMEYALRKREVAVWTPADGVLSFPVMRRNCTPHVLPPHARIVFFHGKPDPWQPEAIAQAPWIEEHYR